MRGSVNRRQFLAVAGSSLPALPLAAAEAAAPLRAASGWVDCQSHLFFPEVLDLMRRRQAEPLVYDRDGTTYLKMGDWLRKVPPARRDSRTAPRAQTPRQHRSPNPA